MFNRNIVATAGFNRWLIPPAALAIHLCIGMAYGFSVFWLPLSQAIGISNPIACAGNSNILDMLFTTSCDWRISDLGWMFTLFFVFLGSSAAIWGGWLERAGPRKAGIVASFCWSGGLLISALGVYTHQLWLMWLGSGVIGGIGLGLGYISPVSTCLKWFPDRRGMAAGMAIMGFGGGAMIGTPFADILMNFFKTSSEVGVWQTFCVLAVIYFVVMIAGSLSYRVPPANWTPSGWFPVSGKMISRGNVHVKDAHKTLQFWLIWVVLMLNVSAGIGVIGMASPMLQEIFAGSLIGHVDLGFSALDMVQKKQVATVAAGFVGLLSLFNIAGRFFWSTISDKISRKLTYAIFFILGFALYALLPSVAHSGMLGLFVIGFCIVLSMYGGGFATVPAYLADMFGTAYVGAIHGRLLTAWSTAGIVGPVLVNYIRDSQIAAGVERALVYDRTFYILSSMLGIGFVCNLLIRPVADRWFIKVPDSTDKQYNNSNGITNGGIDVTAMMVWFLVCIPMAWGVWITISKVMVLFG